MELLIKDQFLTNHAQCIKVEDVYMQSVEVFRCLVMFYELKNVLLHCTNKILFLCSICYFLLKSYETIQGLSVQLQGENALPIQISLSSFRRAQCRHNC